MEYEGNSVSTINNSRDGKCQKFKLQICGVTFVYLRKSKNRCRRIRILASERLTYWQKFSYIKISVLDEKVTIKIVIHVVIMVIIRWCKSVNISF